tara:strand:- start:1211 stop:1429 length:219 start_codon:yes stop_codon:yes gene_type:complete
MNPITRRKGYTKILAIENGMHHSNEVHCPECGCDWYGNKNYCGDGHRTCVDCDQEYWTDIKYEETAERRELQ